MKIKYNLKEFKVVLCRDRAIKKMAREIASVFLVMEKVSVPPTSSIDQRAVPVDGQIVGVDGGAADVGANDIDDVEPEYGVSIIVYNIHRYCGFVSWISAYTLPHAFVFLTHKQKQTTSSIDQHEPVGFDDEASEDNDDEPEPKRPRLGQTLDWDDIVQMAAQPNPPSSDGNSSFLRSLWSSLWK